MQAQRPTSPAERAEAAGRRSARGEPGLDEPAAAGLTVRHVADPRGVALALAGELDLATTPELERHLAAIDEHEIPRLLIDLSELTFMDSTGLSAIVRAHGSGEARGRALVLRRGPGQVQRLLRLTGIHDRLTFEDD